MSYVGGELVGLHVHRVADAAPLGSHLLQRVPLGALDRAGREHVQAFLEAWESGRPERALALFPDPADWLDAVADRKTGREDDERLARLCKRYLELGAKSGWRAILAREFGYDSSSIQTIIGRARRRRFLTKVPRGRYGGQLTPKALRLLAPPALQSAWERATDEQRTAALERDRRHARLSAILLKQLQMGAIDSDTYKARSLALEAEIMGWAPHELDLDGGTLAAVEQQLEFVQNWIKEQR
jgi:hypothetical protein